MSILTEICRKAQGRVSTYSLYSMSGRKAGPHSPGRERYREREYKNRDYEEIRHKSDRDRRTQDGSLSRTGDGSRESRRRRSKERGSGRGRRDGDERERERGLDRGKDRQPKDQKGGYRSRSRGGSREEPRRLRSRSPLSDQQASFDKSRQGTGKSNPSDAPKKDKEKPNFENTGLLAAASNTVNSVVLKYTEPVDSRLPPAHSRWRLFTFKDGQIVGNPLDLNAQPTWLIGRDRLVADIPVDHPSCSKQHAVIQFRSVAKKNEFGDRVGGVKPYVIDLESANGTFLNKMKLEERRFVEMREGDLLMLGESTR